ncbi:Putative glycosyltransferase EpsE [Aeoliella mucimassa]|uniref:Glycosyltransferase EpsE n=2 Tax=Aeoliella mucimassa TaxID=2527972 RepID=A0A518AQA4_9BACT|nr:Putative glycosyltransferase EpsE [Aeoliella mucimassa]
MRPLISVIMPVYNAERYVAEAVESILAQTCGDFEFLIVDDGSSDRSLAILEKYASKDKRIRLKSRANTGYVVALNEMLADAEGEFIARMDADDISLPERFEKQIAYLQEHPECVVLGTNTVLVDDGGWDIRPGFHQYGHEAIDGHHLTSLGGCVSHPSVMMRAAAVAQVGGYRVECCPAEDVDIFLRLGEIGQLENLTECLLKYRMHPKSVSRTNAARQRNIVAIAQSQARSRRNLPEVSSELAEDVTLDRYSSEALNTNISSFDVLVNWGWWALGAGNRSTAAKMVARSLVRNPFRYDSWVLAFCVLRGR